MKALPIDPAPRSYPEHVLLCDRSQRGAACAPAQQTTDEVRQWLLHEAIHADNLMLLYEEYLWRCRAAGLPIDRSSLHVGTLHPQMVGLAWNWKADDAVCDEVAAFAGALSQDAFTKNPLYKVLVDGETVPLNLENREEADAYPLMQELAAEGYTAYTAFPLSSSGKRFNGITFATKHPGGYPEDKVAVSLELVNLFALHIEKHIVQRIARNVADTYLGPLAGRRVLEGEIRRGDGEAINAIVFVADIRDFTGLADRLSGPELTAVLNAYFERLSSAIENHGGEILKFIGDGVLAVFQQGEAAASQAALAAAEDALQAIDDLNRAPDGDLPDPRAWQPLKIGIGLHKGDVFFGNVGGADRLDFTVIGRAVNEAARVETLCKTLSRNLLLADPVVQDLPETDRERLELMGHYDLRGVAQPVAIYSPRADGAVLPNPAET
ncbi:adenylate/guanylate cyclase domain-containing protein [Roseibium sp. RKSG952]|uniref:adenylate/guanylate cyclase domain-containing protein n=1 Tax=Roseibium sp. RKSG952 TaxID=2529384 RepID=UPI0012BC3599|nr:adenylate/guanylate cyclase domain-containing protein [Roseibium sp. RKSG952]MTH95458.1 adenylate/guanylate cyclase domain-containing protein [Roseibium sp. RKSG952]